MKSHSKKEAWFTVFKCFPDGTKEEVCSLKGNRYLALQEAFKQHRHDNNTLFIVRQTRWPHRESEHDVTIASYGPHFPIGYISSLD